MHCNVLFKQSRWKETHLELPASSVLVDLMYSQFEQLKRRKMVFCETSKAEKSIECLKLIERGRRRDRSLNSEIEQELVLLLLFVI